MHHHFHSVLPAAALAGATLLLFPPLASAVTTRTWVTTTYADFDAGHEKGVLVSSLGQVVTGHAHRRAELAAELAYCAVAAPDGTVYTGTGVPAEIWALPPGAAKAHRVAKLDGVDLVGSLALGPDGTLFAGTVGKGEIVTVSATGTVKPFVTLDGAEHVWALDYDPAARTLYAATGPHGKLYAVDASGHARVVWTSSERQLLSMARATDGALWVGSAPHALVFRVDPVTGQARAVHDFDGDEVRAVVLHGADAYVAVNHFEKEKGEVPGPAPDTDHGTQMTAPAAGQPGAANPTAEPPIPRPNTAKGKGAVFHIDPLGNVEQVHALADGFFTSLAADADGTIWAGAGSNGRAYEILPDRTVLTALDLPERSLLAIVPLPGGNHVVATGDAGSLYTVTRDPPADATYTSKAFDAQFISRWGTIAWRGDGRLQVQTRSGNTATPDSTWSAWADPTGPTGASEGVGKVASPRAEYLQYRVRFVHGPATLREMTVYYLPQNQRPKLSDLQVGDPDASRSGGPYSTADSPKPNSAVATITWKENDPDGDDLDYRLYYRQEGETEWRRLGTSDRPLTQPTYDWDTAAVPDGWYEIRVVASDEPANPPALALTDQLISTPYLVDNHKPEVADLSVAYPTVAGRARDSFSRIAEISYDIDGGPFRLAFPRDGIYDDPVEDFEIQLGKLTPGTHTLVVRAEDEAGNIGAVERTFRVRP